MIPGTITRPVAVQPASALWDPAVQAGTPQPTEPGQKPAPVQGANTCSTSGNVGSVARWQGAFHTESGTPKLARGMLTETRHRNLPLPANSNEGLGGTPRGASSLGWPLAAARPMVSTFTTENSTPDSGE